MSQKIFVAAVLTLFFAPGSCTGSHKFLEHSAGISSGAFQRDVMNAMGSMLGCGGQASPHKVAAIEKALKPMWRTLPKPYGWIQDSRIDRRSLRYLVHRYFMQTSSLMIRGFEPTRPMDDHSWGKEDILSQVVPAYVESVLESHHAKQHGFSLEDAVNMVVMIEQLVFDSESVLLEKVYDLQKKPIHRLLSYKGLVQVMESYILEWMIEAPEEDMRQLRGNYTLVTEVLPHYAALLKFAEGRVKALQYSRSHGAGQKRGHGKAAWTGKFSFQDAHEIVGGITRSFQSFWQSECDAMKSTLISMDDAGTGRVRLAKFYGTAISTEWRFGESEAYLRELGALDETSTWAGPQVLIPNYLQATSNCIVSTPHYLVCCVNECESLLGEIEAEIGAPTALPSQLLEIVGNMTAQTSIDDDFPPNLQGELTEQLEHVAKTHGGLVPLHGRLFAQWLHYVFPRECAFPHKAGMVSTATPVQYGDDHVATESDMKRYASNASAIPVSVGKDELQWMSQWSADEELLVDYSSELSMPLWKRLLIATVGLVFMAAGVGGGVIGCSGPGKGSSKPSAFSV